MSFQEFQIGFLDKFTELESSGSETDKMKAGQQTAQSSMNMCLDGDKMC